VPPSLPSDDMFHDRSPSRRLTDEQVRELRLRILANLYNSPLVVEAVARRMLHDGDL
jgi:hypothetical protein